MKIYADLIGNYKKQRIKSLCDNNILTGEYALNDDGRKGYWVFVKGSDGTSSTNTKQYTKEEAKRIVAMMRSQGLDAMYTCGTLPKRPLHYAFINNEEAIKNALKEKLRNI